MVEDNNKLRDFLNITSWHKAGYTGKNIKVASGERLSNDSSVHSWKTAATLLEVAPEAQVIELPWEGIYNDNFGLNITSGIKTEKVAVWWGSFSSNAKLRENSQKHFLEVSKICPLIMSGGNKNSQKEVSTIINYPFIIGINACSLMVDNRLFSAYYNFSSDFIDYCSLDGWWLSSGTRFVGTSAAAPAFAGMAALVQQMALEQLDRFLSTEEIKKFFDKCVIKIDDGKTTGKGCPILPNPIDLDLKSFIGIEGEKEMKYYHNLEEIPYWAKPIIAEYIEKGVLKGDEFGDLNLSEDLLRLLVILKRIFELKEELSE